MPYPKVSILWLNYNSSRILDIVKRSLDSVKNLDYPNFELIVIDNASSDNSYSFIKNYLDEKACSFRCRIKFGRTSRNLGYVGGNNFAYYLRDKESKYVVVMNNDFIATSESLKIMVEIMESDQSIGALQGKILDISGRKIDSAGGFIDEFLRVRFPFRAKPPQYLSKEIEVSFVEGTFPIYRVTAIRGILGDFLFPPEGFVYFLKDVFIGLKLWNNGYRSICIPIEVGKHFRGGSLIENNFLLFHLIKNRTALLFSSNSRVKLFGFISILKSILKTSNRNNERKVMLDAFLQGLILGYKILRKYGAIDIYSAPLIKCRIFPFS